MPSRLPNIYLMEPGPPHIGRATMIPYDSIKLRFRQTPTQEFRLTELLSRVPPTVR